MATPSRCLAPRAAPSRSGNTTAKLLPRGHRRVWEGSGCLESLGFGSTARLGLALAQLSCAVKCITATARFYCHGFLLPWRSLQPWIEESEHATHPQAPEGRTRLPRLSKQQIYPLKMVGLCCRMPPGSALRLASAACPVATSVEPHAASASTAPPRQPSSSASPWPSSAPSCHGSGAGSWLWARAWRARPSAPSRRGPSSSTALAGSAASESSFAATSVAANAMPPAAAAAASPRADRRLVARTARPVRSPVRCSARTASAARGAARSARPAPTPAAGSAPTGCVSSSCLAGGCLHSCRENPALRGTTTRERLPASSACSWPGSVCLLAMFYGML